MLIFRSKKQMTKTIKTVKPSNKDQMAQFVTRQRAFVRELVERKFTAVPHLQIGHEKTLAEARALLVKAEAKLATL